MDKTKCFFGSLFVLAVMLFSCERTAVLDGDLTANTIASLSPIVPVINPTLPSALCGSSTYELIGGKTLDAGHVTIANDGEFLYILVHAKDGFQAVSENVKIWLGASDPNIVFNGKRPIPGKLPYKFTVTSGLDFSVKFALADLITDYNCATAPKLYAIIDVDAIVDDPNSTSSTLETAYAGNIGEILGSTAWWYAVNFTPTCCSVTPPPQQTITTCSDETGWSGIDKVGTSAWWYYFEVADGLVQNIYAGQTMLVGTVTYDPNAGTLTISLNQGLIGTGTYNATLKGTGEDVKIAGFTTIPSYRPDAGNWKYQGTPIPTFSAQYKGEDLVVNVASFPYYAIHLDLNVCQTLIVAQ